MEELLADICIGNQEIQSVDVWGNKKCADISINVPFLKLCFINYPSSIRKTLMTLCKL